MYLHILIHGRQHSQWAYGQVVRWMRSVYGKAAPTRWDSTISPCRALRYDILDVFGREISNFYGHGSSLDPCWHTLFGRGPSCENYARTGEKWRHKAVRTLYAPSRCTIRVHFPTFYLSSWPGSALLFRASSVLYVNMYLCEF